MKGYNVLVSTLISTGVHTNLNNFSLQQRRNKYIQFTSIRVLQNTIAFVVGVCLLLLATLSQFFFIKEGCMNGRGHYYYPLEEEICFKI